MLLTHFIGAAMAVEDGAALAEALSQITYKSQMSLALSVFEHIRIERSSQMQEASLLNGILWHFADGPAQRARDRAMLPEVDGRPFLRSPNQWSDPVTQSWCFGYDAEGAISDAFSGNLKEHEGGQQRTSSL
jgi:salicylate hydroxylase